MRWCKRHICVNDTFWFPFNSSLLPWQSFMVLQIVSYSVQGVHIISIHHCGLQQHCQLQPTLAGVWTVVESLTWADVGWSINYEIFSCWLEYQLHKPVLSIMWWSSSLASGYLCEVFLLNTCQWWWYSTGICSVISLFSVFISFTFMVSWHTVVSCCFWVVAGCFNCNVIAFQLVYPPVNIWIEGFEPWVS